MPQPAKLVNFDPQAVYGAAALDYEKASATYWSFLGERTIARLALQPGARVLDAACGTGWSALAAAEIIGASGQVIAVDYAEQMLELARVKAQQRGLQNIEFHIGDITQLQYPDAHFDAVVCVLGIFFIEDMVKQVAELWRMVRAGGQLAITTIGPHFFTPLLERWKTAVSSECPDLRIAPPWERTNDPGVLSRLMTDGGVLNAEVNLEHNRLPLQKPADWWQIVIGSGLRKYVDEMGTTVAARVRENNLVWAQNAGITSLELSAIYVVATKTDGSL